jgi:hypothetical protein
MPGYGAVTDVVVESHHKTHSQTILSTFRTASVAIQTTARSSMDYGTTSPSTVVLQ